LGAGVPSASRGRTIIFRSASPAGGGGAGDGGAGGVFNMFGGGGAGGNPMIGAVCVIYLAHF